MIRYKKYKNNNSTSKNYGQWYGRAVHEKMEFDEFVHHMAVHHCVFSEATIRGVLIEMETCLREMLLEGKAVRFDDLGIFKLGISCNGANAVDEFNNNNIRSVHLNLYLGKRFRASRLLADATFKEADVYGSFYDDLKDDDDDDENGTVEP